MDSPVTADEFAWVDQIEAWTVAVMRRLPLSAVLAIYGRGEAEAMGDLTFSEVDDHRRPELDRLDPFLQVLQLDRHTVTIEHNGFSGAFPEIARRCSADSGRFFSVYWNIHAAGQVTQAINGTVVARFESLFPIEPDTCGGDRRPAWAIGSEVPAELTWRTCMAQLHLQTGVIVEERWIREPLLTYRIPEPYWLYRDVAGAEQI